jgi:hypothetical protein
VQFETIIALVSLGATFAGVGVTYGVLSTRVSTVEREIERKASKEALDGLTERLTDLRKHIDEKFADLLRAIERGG